MTKNMLYLKKLDAISIPKDIAPSQIDVGTIIFRAEENSDSEKP